MTGGKGGKGKKKKNSIVRSHSQASSDSTVPSNPVELPTTAGVTSSKKALDPELLLKRSQLLREQGNQQFSERRFGDALYTYEIALRCLPDAHKDRAVIYSNRAACHLHISPISYDSVLVECNKALAIQADHPKALLRRARAFVGLQNPELAIVDLNLCLKANPDNKDAMDLLVKLQTRKAEVSHKAPKQAEKPQEDSSEQRPHVEDWFVELARLVQGKLGFDPLITEPSDYESQAIIQAIEETTCMEEAVPLLETVESKFRSMSSILLLNWGNVHRVLAQRRARKGPKVELTEEVEQGGQSAEAAEEGESSEQREEASAEGEEAQKHVESDKAEEDISAQLAECDWSVSHLESAIEKFSQAVQIQPDLVDATLGRANALAQRGKLLERRAELLPLAGLSVPRALLADVQQTYQTAASEFIACKANLDSMKKEFEEHKASCADASHGHGEDGEGNHFLQITESYRGQIFSSWMDTLASLALLQYKLGLQEWRATLKEAQEMEPSLEGTEFEGADLLGPLPPAMLVGSEAEGSGSVVVSSKGHEWARIWQSPEAGDGPEKHAVAEAEAGTGTGTGTGAGTGAEAESAVKAEGAREGRKARPGLQGGSAGPAIEVGKGGATLAGRLEREQQRRSGAEEGGALLSETDEPMTPVADLVGKFLLMAKQGSH